eukprot:SAG31_NODE_2952_length_4869_cov_4.122432_3_plen_90_part_00
MESTIIFTTAGGTRSSDHQGGGARSLAARAVQTPGRGGAAGAPKSGSGRQRKTQTAASTAKIGSSTLCTMENIVVRVAGGGVGGLTSCG